ncbi:MAG: cation diffusion facilitator family transporter [Candidatus Symbiothrix sp.]|jgi:cation diffusion facilitator family transporter|nr:cation diffusion facilitator family transporter [Candidatus Symbiothrix sp.]
MDSREKILLRTSWVSIFGNVLLSLLKIVAGWISGSLAVLSDGLDSASDVVTSILILIATPIVHRPPNSKFVYGQGKAEYVVSTILSFVIFFVGCQMFVTAIQKIIHPEILQSPSGLALWITVVSIVGKLLLSWFQFRQGKRVDSSMLKANAINMRNDVIISVGVLVGLALTRYLDLPILDPIVALLISLYIIWSAVGIFREANLVLMNGIDDTSIYQSIIQAAEKIPDAHHPHRIRVEQIGACYNIVLDIEVAGELSLRDAHHIANQVEDSIKQAVPVYDVVVHVEPVGVQHRHEETYGISRENLKEG